MFELKKYRGVFFYDTEEWFKLEEKVTCGLKNDMRNFENFHQSTQKCQNWDFDEVLSSKVENLRAQNLQRSYVAWQWRMMENL